MSKIVLRYEDYVVEKGDNSVALTRIELVKPAPHRSKRWPLGLIATTMPKDLD